MTNEEIKKTLSHSRKKSVYYPILRKKISNLPNWKSKKAVYILIKSVRVAGLNISHIAVPVLTNTNNHPLGAPPPLRLFKNFISLKVKK